jgi:hypothetical protein
LSRWATIKNSDVIGRTMLWVFNPAPPSGAYTQVTISGYLSTTCGSGAPTHEYVFWIGPGSYHEEWLSATADPEELRRGCLRVTASAPVLVMGHLYNNRPSGTDTVEPLTFFPTSW